MKKRGLNIIKGKIFRSFSGSVSAALIFFLGLLWPVITGQEPANKKITKARAYLSTSCSLNKPTSSIYIEEEGRERGLGSSRTLKHRDA
jgi:hypothetical protein